MDNYTRLLLRAVKQIKRYGKAQFKTLRDLKEYQTFANVMRDIGYLQERFAHG